MSSGAGRPIALARVVLVGALTLGLAAGATWLLVVAWLAARARVAAPGPANADEVVVLAAASVALAITAWLLLGATLEAMSYLPGRVGTRARSWSDRLTPALARRVAAFALGVGVGVAGGPTQALAAGRDGSLVASAADSTRAAGGPVRATPTSPPAAGFDALATEGPSVPEAAQPTAPPSTIPTPAIPTPAIPTPGATVRAPLPGFAPPAPAPGFTPAAPRVRPQVDPELITGRPGPEPATDARIVVHRGDSLWAIAARHLGADASDAEIARAWPVWFAVNREVIGSDPDRLLPGQLLRRPTTDEFASIPAGATP